MPKKSARQIQHLLSKGQFRYSIHCDQMRTNRVITDGDVRAVGRTAHTIKLQSNGSYKVVGYDKNEFDLTVICRFMESKNLLIITVY